MADKFTPEEQKAFDDVQKEKADLGIVDEPVEEKTEEKKTEEEEVVEDDEESEDDSDEEDPSKQISTKEDEEDDEDEDKFDFKAYKKGLKEQLQSDFDKKLADAIAEAKKHKPDEKTTVDLESEIKALAKELDFDEDKVRKIIQVARKGTELSPEDKELLAEFKENRDYIKGKKEEDFMREQKEIFDTEWTSVIPVLKAQFPNATDEQLAQAKKEMDALSHTEKYSKTELDYIVFKEKAKFEKVLFSPKQKTFESGRAVDMSTTDEFPIFSNDMTPAQFEAFEKRRNAMMDSGQGRKVTVTSMGENGNIEEREE